MPDVDYTIIGRGVIGCAIAYKLRQQFPEEIIIGIDKNPKFPGENQSSRNSGVLHAGIYYDKLHSPQKARLCVEGNEELYQLAKRYDLPLRRTGKLIVATNSQEDESLDMLLQRASQNNVPGVKKLTARQTEKIEENVNAYSSLWVPTSGIVEATRLTQFLDAKAEYDERFDGFEVTQIKRKKDAWVIHMQNQQKGVSETFSTEYLINAAGLYSDNVARMINPNFQTTIFPVRGEAAKFYQTRANIKVRRNVYPAPRYYRKPDGSMHLTVGVHLTPTFELNAANGLYVKEGGKFAIAKEVTVGPLNRMRGDQVGKEGYAIDLAGTDEFFEQIRSFFPNIKREDLHLHQTGIQAVSANKQDYQIEPDTKNPTAINLVGICSPGLTSCLAIADEVIKLIR